jgi:hypothetical protein
MITSKFCSALESIYNKHFPQSKAFAKFDSLLYSSIYVNCFLAGSKEENSGGYWYNDLLNITFRIITPSGEFPKDVTADSELPNIIMIENVKKSYFLKPENQYMAYGRRKLSFRKAEGSAEKVLQVFEKFCIALKKSLMEDLKNDMIHNNHKELLTKKLGV